MKHKLIIGTILGLFIVYAGCRKTDPEPDVMHYSTEPTLPAQPYTYTNSTSNDMATLGRVLFYDQKMSLNNSVSCGSCHQQSKAFCDGKKFSTGLQDMKTRRNSPAVIVHAGDLFWDGRAGNFSQLALMPLVNHVEMMNYDVSKLQNKVASISYYPELFNKAFGDNQVTIQRIQNAIASFLDNFTFENNKNMLVMNNQASFTVEEELGKQLFYGKANCGNCHAGPSFAGWSGGSACIGLDETYADNGIGELNHNTADNAKFRIPTLLNIEFTAPYMHDGRFNTLEEVIEHYNSGVKNHPNLSWNFRDFSAFENMTEAQLLAQLDINHNGVFEDNELPSTPLQLHLTGAEKKALLAFLKTLSDPSVFTDPRFSDPFQVKQ